MIGLGLLGSAIAERLAASGFPLVGFDIDGTRTASFESAGGEIAASVAEVMQRCDRVVLALPTSDVASAVLADAGASLRAGSILIDATTGHPDEEAARGEQLAARGIGYLDATIGGSGTQVRQQKVIVMVGGRRDDYDACADVWESFASRAFYLGSWGCGARMKLVFNMALGLHRAVLAETLMFARRYGLSMESALEVLRAGPAYSRVVDTKGEKMLRREFAPEGRLSQHLKDVRLMIEAGRLCGARLPLTGLHRQLLEQVEAEGYGDLDNSAIIRAFD
jgi:3-hydroxyisobutyrate dehydrogenase-like beta-hydroxyacid dehydrogenase